MKKKILFISNMYPSKQKPYAGIFVKNHVDFFIKYYSDVFLTSKYVMQRKFTGKFGSIFKYFMFWLGFSRHLFVKYDIIHIHYIFPNLVLGYIYKIFYPNTKLYITLHGRDITVQYPQYKFLLNFFISKIDVLIPVGKTLKALSEKYFPIVDKLVLRVGVDDLKFKKLDAIIKKYDFIFVGSFIHRKGVDYLIDTLKEINKYKFNVLFIGSGNLKKDILLIDNHKVEILENLSQKEINKYLNMSKWFMLPSRNEGFPTVTIESFYAGTPVIGSNIPQIQEQIVDSVNGFMFEVESKEKLKNTLLKAFEISDEDYKKMAINSLNSFKNISLTNICKMIKKSYLKSLKL